jgi:hypothetical protein
LIVHAWRIVKAESNFLLNPAHPQFEKIARKKARPYRFDSRLLKQ